MVSYWVLFLLALLLLVPASGEVLVPASEKVSVLASEVHLDWAKARMSEFPSDLALGEELASGLDPVSDSVLAPWLVVEPEPE
jgi:hypothetical protein